MPEVFVFPTLEPQDQKKQTGSFKTRRLIVRWEDVIYSNGAIRKEKVGRARVLWLRQPSPSWYGWQGSPGASILSQAICLVVILYLTRSLSCGEGAHQTEGNTYSPRGFRGSSQLTSPPATRRGPGGPSDLSSSAPSLGSPPDYGNVPACSLLNRPGPQICTAETDPDRLLPGASPWLSCPVPGPNQTWEGGMHHIGP